MKISNLILVLFVCSLFLNCEYDDLDSNLPYFHFISKDRPNLLTLPELDTKLVFVNKNNKELEFEVIKSERIKDYQGKGNWVTSSIKKFFFFDKQEVFLRSTLLDIDRENTFFKITVRRWPESFNDGSDGRAINISRESLLSTRVDYAPFRNRGISSWIEYKSSLKMILNNKQYSKVIKIDLTETDASSGGDWPLPALNFIYFDINEGFIGFDDRDGNEWRLKS